MGYDTVCWACHNNTMQPKGDYYQCSKCGASWNEQPNMSGIFQGTEPCRGVMSKGKISRPKRSRRSTLPKR